MTGLPTVTSCILRVSRGCRDFGCQSFAINIGFRASPSAGGGFLIADLCASGSCGVHHILW